MRFQDLSAEVTHLIIEYLKPRAVLSFIRTCRGALLTYKHRDNVLAWAAENRRINLFESLLEKGADINLGFYIGD
jgi:ankyrin repeat protein